MTQYWEDKQSNLKMGKGPWLVWLSGLSTGLQIKGSLVQFPVRAHASVVGQVPRWGCERQLVDVSLTH